MHTHTDIYIYIYIYIMARQDDIYIYTKIVDGPTKEK